MVLFWNNTKLLKHSKAYFLKSVLQRDTALSKVVSNVIIHQKMLSQILEYEHKQAQVWILYFILYKHTTGKKNNVTACYFLQTFSERTP